MISAPVEERRPLASPLEAAGRSRAGALAQRLPTDLAELRRRRRPVPETRRSYGTDVGGEAPFYLGTAARAELRALEQLRSEGLAVLEAPEAQELRQLLRLPRAVREAGAEPHGVWDVFGLSSLVLGLFEVPSREVCATLGCQAPQEPSAGRRHFLLRGTEAAE